MPTGYTADVVTGKVTKFEDFALTCARAFGALITMKEDPLDKPIPDSIKPYPWQLEQLNKAEARLAEVVDMTVEQCESAAKEAAAKQADADKRYHESVVRDNERYQAMLEKVQRWEPPTADHVHMKAFMVDQLSISMSKVPEVKEAPVLTAHEWQAQEIAKCQRDIEYHSNEWAEEVKRAKERTEWIQQLKASLAAYEE